MELPAVLRLPRVDDEASFAVLHVSSAGRSALDLKLIGTDGESVFALPIKHKKTSSFRAKNFNGSQEEFDHVLSAVLLGAERDDETRGIEALAKVDEEHMTINIQRRIEGITQRYAEFKLPTTDEEISIFEWCGSTIQARDKGAAKIEELKKKLQAKDLQTQQLKDELSTLVEDKSKNENSLIEKFSLLLNEKKLKIRDQQRLLASAVVDPAKLEALESSRLDVKSRPPGPSRKGKRKVVKEESDEESDGFEQMDVDADEQDNDSDEGQATPDPESTADEASDDDDEPPQLPPPKKKTVNESKSKTKSGASIEPAKETVPPPRALPFGKKKAVSPPKPVAAATADSETESDDDDEL